MKHIDFFSGGGGSWKTSKILIDLYGIENVLLLFTDTYIEDDDLYRFLIESSQEMFGIDQSDLLEMTKSIPKISHETMQERKVYLQELAKLVRERNPSFVWISDGRDPWEVFKDVRFIGNSRIAQCSHKLKQEVARKWIEENFKPDECTLYLGIDWTEDHRTKAPTENWKPYTVKFPLCEEPYYTKDEIFEEMSKVVKVPRLYGMNFAHNNCGGFCVRAGQGHFINLLQKNPELYTYHESKEQEMRDFLNKDVSMLRRSKTVGHKTILNDEGEEVTVPNVIKYPLTLRQLREEWEAKNTCDIDMDDIGGCGCFVSYQ